MEKIKEALAKAKLQGATQPAAEKKLDKPAKTLVEARETDLGKIEYTDTAVIRLDQQHLEKNRVISHVKQDINTGVFDSLRTQILQKMEENNWRTIAIVSPTPESGKTLVSINLAFSIAHQPNKTAVLVDFDLRRPKVATYLGIHTEKSINDYLQNKADISEIMFNPGMPRLAVMPTMRPVSRSAETLSSSKVTNLIQELRERYESRIVIIDLPPILNTDDAMVVFPQVDCVLMVVANGMSKPAEIEEAMRHLPKEKVLGVVLNKAEVESKAYYY